MSRHWVSTLGVAVVLAIGGQSPIGRGELAIPAPAASDPFDSLHFRPLGPAAMSGRISDLAVYRSEPQHFLCRHGARGCVENRQ